MASFPFGGCVDEFSDSGGNYYGYTYDVHFLHCHTFIIIHFVNDERVR